MKEISNQGKYILGNYSLKPKKYGQCLDNCDLNQEYFTSYFNDIRHRIKIQNVEFIVCIYFIFRGY